jgi:hypothetical protein
MLSSSVYRCFTRHYSPSLLVTTFPFIIPIEYLSPSIVWSLCPPSTTLLCNHCVPNRSAIILSSLCNHVPPPLPLPRSLSFMPPTPKSNCCGISSLAPALFRGGVLVPGDFQLDNSGSLPEYLLPPGENTLRLQSYSSLDPRLMA